ncbi:MAG: twin-arginine translocation signal domain-containing protein [Thermodesulfobacteriota bacterium]|nr:twin-arginine translocation signal domain-containing protein [Thermodesulfobacteriota bacterium]
MDNEHDINERRSFLKKACTATLAAGTVSLGGLFVKSAKADDYKDSVAQHWEKNQKKCEALEKKYREEYKAFDAPPKYIYRGTDYTDSKSTFYAPLMEECKYLPEFQSIFTEGTAGQYFRHTMKFGMKDIIKYHGHSCEALYYTAALCRLMCDKLFSDKVVDRTILRGMGGNRHVSEILCCT